MLTRLFTLLVLTLFAVPLWAQSTIDGDWDFSMSSPFGVVRAQVTLITEGDTLSGQFDLGNGRIWPIENGTVSGDSISFSITRDGPNLTYGMRADIDGDSASGVASAMGTTSPWTMTRRQ